MLAPFRRGVGDLAGLGVFLDPSQVAMLAQPRGLALVAWAVPDPYNVYEGGSEKLAKYHPIRGWEPVLFPVLLNYDNRDEFVGGTGYFSNGRWQQQWKITDFVEECYGDNWDQYPSLAGHADLPGSPSWPDYSIFRLWDCWPISPHDAEIVSKIAATAWYGTKNDEFEHFIQVENGWCELDPDDEDELAVLKQLQDVCLDEDGTIKITVDDLTPQLDWTGQNELRMLWGNLKASSRRAWRSVELSIKPQFRGMLRYEEGAYSPWF